MHMLHILLQLLILTFFIPIFFVFLLHRPFEPQALAAASGLFLFLLLLTLLLREHTENRLNPLRENSPKPLGALLVFLGCGLEWLSWLMVTEQYHPDGRRGQMLVIVIKLIGPWLPAAVFFVLGMQLVWFGFRAWRGR
ncbi:hypothetical protein [Azotobacter chroococcum]|uniref:hypothetical protein n=1 Tax=Azotobacter chroococcum TaxID=353 RepID=UPI000584CCD3|nr:hypothetical protein [Azotobacter chroococcum]